MRAAGDCGSHEEGLVSSRDGRAPAVTMIPQMDGANGVLQQQSWPKYQQDVASVCL